MMDGRRAGGNGSRLEAFIEAIHGAEKVRGASGASTMSGPEERTRDAVMSVAEFQRRREALLAELRLREQDNDDRAATSVEHEGALPDVRMYEWLPAAPYLPAPRAAGRKH
jgi:hypothetical protein